MFQLLLAERGRMNHVLQQAFLFGILQHLAEGLQILRNTPQSLDDSLPVRQNVWCVAHERHYAIVYVCLDDHGRSSDDAHKFFYQPTRLERGVWGRSQEVRCVAEKVRACKADARTLSPADWVPTDKPGQGLLR